MHHASEEGNAMNRTEIVGYAHTEVVDDHLPYNSLSDRPETGADELEYADESDESWEDED